MPKLPTLEFEKVCDKVRSNHKFDKQTLDLSKHQLDNNDIKLLITALEPNTTIHHLDLSWNEISGDGAVYLANMKNKNIISLNLSFNRLNYEANVLFTNPNFQELDLSHNKIIGAGIRPVADNTTLKKLSLHSTLIGDSGAEHLSRNKSILELDICNTKIGDIGAKKLALNHTIKKLNIAYNPLTDEGIEAVVSWMRLEEVYFGKDTNVTTAFKNDLILKNGKSVPSLQNITAGVIIKHGLFATALYQQLPTAAQDVVTKYNVKVHF